ncbi:hypothetical protein PG985_012249 [Apiospora marii]|uniref:uncharacterized protein n=1 Tax=Apiospora marii TaxID=335849 RepID=UPI00312D5F2A
MPLWEIFHSMDAFTGPLDTTWLAGNITKLYAAQALPAFYVNVLFFPMQAGSYFVSGAPANRLPGYGEGQVARDKPYVRISIQHIAIHCNEDQDKVNAMLERIDNVLRAHIEEKSYDWEYNVLEPDRAKWEINGIKPPQHPSDEEQKWFRDGKPSHWQ